MSAGMCFKRMGTSCCGSGSEVQEGLCTSTPGLLSVLWEVRQPPRERDRFWCQTVLKGKPDFNEKRR